VQAFDVAPSGRTALAEGRRLSLEGVAPIDLEFEPLRCRFRGEDLVVLGRKSELLSIAKDGKVRGVVRVREGALDVAVLRGGSVVVSYGRRGAQRHGVTLERLGDAPCVFKDSALLDATCLAAESGALWVLGTAAEQPTARALKLRPVAGGFAVKEVVALQAPPRSAAVGPDGALFVILEPGESLVRVEAGVAGTPIRLPAPLHALARDGRKLLGRGAKGVEDLSRFVPRPLADARRPELPPCSP
jgi:hypothetical protein